MNDPDILLDQFATLKGAMNKKKNLFLMKDIIQYYTDKGGFDFRDVFWSKLTMDQQQEFVKAVFNYLISCSSEEKIMVLELLEAIYLQFTVEKSELREQIFSIFYAALFEKHNYELALSALKLFSILWVRTTIEMILSVLFSSSKIPKNCSKSSSKMKLMKKNCFK